MYSRRKVILIEKAQKEDLKEILELQYLAYQSEVKFFGNMDIPPLSKPLKKYMMNLKEEQFFGSSQTEDIC